MCLDKSYIVNTVKEITNREFSDPVEKGVIEYNDRVNFRCPYCHEGKVKSKKRGNVYYNRLMMICFRCDTKVSFDKFCRDFDIKIDPQKKLDMIEYMDNVYSTYESFKSDDYVDLKFSNLININELESALKLQQDNISDFTPIVKNKGVYLYLLKRGIHPGLHKNLYQAKYWKNENEFEWVIIMLNRKDDLVLGMQLRNLKGGHRRMFKVYNYESLYEIVKKKYPEKEELDMNDLVIYNKISYYYNILNINFDNRVTVFEGYLDSLFFPNSIGMVGVNTNSRFLEESEIDLQFFFDNDFVGNKKAEEKLKKGKNVFLWNKFIETTITNNKKGNPIVLKNKLDTIKDLNRLNEIIPNAYSKLKLQSYFSSDIFDLIWIPKYKKYNKKEIDITKYFG